MNTISKLFSNENSWTTPKSEIRESQIGGRGLFAIEDITLGEEVVIWKGNYTDKQSADESRKAGKLVMQWDEDLFSIEDRGDDDGYFINHSCDSNLWMIDAYTLIAKRAIKVGEEITADYALWEADENYISKWECNCKSPDCRKKITGMDWKLKPVQQKYKDHFSPLINKKIISHAQ